MDINQIIRAAAILDANPVPPMRLLANVPCGRTTGHGESCGGNDPRYYCETCQTCIRLAGSILRAIQP